MSRELYNGDGPINKQSGKVIVRILLCYYLQYPQSCLACAKRISFSTVQLIVYAVIIDLKACVANEFAGG